MTTHQRRRPAAPPRYDRIVSIERPTVTRDRYGSEVTMWSEVAEVWASVSQTGVSAKFENDSNRKLALRNSTFRIRWRDDVTELMRVVYDGLLWDIRGIAEVGLRRGLELICQTDVSRVAPPEVSLLRSPEEPQSEEPKPPQDPALKPPPPKRT